jgi:hypothetical protein
MFASGIRCGDESRPRVHGSNATTRWRQNCCRVACRDMSATRVASVSHKVIDGRFRWRGMSKVHYRHSAPVVIAPVTDDVLANQVDDVREDVSRLFGLLVPPAEFAEAREEPRVESSERVGGPGMCLREFHRFEAFRVGESNGSGAEREAALRVADAATVQRVASIEGRPFGRPSKS